jgi:hypothetical protein
MGLFNWFENEKSSSELAHEQAYNAGRESKDNGVFGTLLDWVINDDDDHRVDPSELRVTDVPESKRSVVEPSECFSVVPPNKSLNKPIAGLLSISSLQRIYESADASRPLG